jgi:hypothetical protein
LSPLEGIFEREMENKQDKPLVNPAFAWQWVEPLSNPKNDVDLIGSIDYVYVTVDPNGWGYSRCTMTSTAEHVINGKKRFVVPLPPLPPGRQTGSWVVRGGAVSMWHGCRVPCAA